MQINLTQIKCSILYLFAVPPDNKARCIQPLALTFSLLISFAEFAAGKPSHEVHPPAFRHNDIPPEMSMAGSDVQWYVIAMRPERDPEAILQDTFNEAARNKTAGALIKFISRNPGHPLADKARKLLETGNYAPARKTAAEFVDSKIVKFDAARRAGPAALKQFIADYPDHPLAREARRLLGQ
jgi:hypothetical protein